MSPKKSLHTTQAPVRFTASTHTLNLKQGATGTVTGHAEIQTTAGWQPLPNTTISLAGLDASNRPSFEVGETTTDSHGAYTLRVSSYNAAPAAELMAGTVYMPFQQLATEPFSLHVAYATHLDMSADLTDTSSLKVSGYVYYEDARAHWPAKPTVTLQYSKDGKSGWKNASTIPITIRHNKPLFEEDFARTFTTKNTNAYWRARFDGNPDLATNTTKPVHLYRYATRITGFHASANPVRKNQAFTFAGTLQYKNGTLQYKNGTTWKPLYGGSPPSTSSPAAPPHTATSPNWAPTGTATSSAWRPPHRTAPGPSPSAARPETTTSEAPRSPTTSTSGERPPMPLFAGFVGVVALVVAARRACSNSSSHSSQPSHGPADLPPRAPVGLVAAGCFVFPERWPASESITVFVR